MKALSIRQPWAWLILRPDLKDPDEWQRAIDAGLVKDIENRSWPTKFRGDFLIHTSALYTRAQHAEYQQTMRECFEIELPAYDAMQTGGIVGTARILDCVVSHPSRWKEGNSWGFVLALQRPIPFIPYKGRLSFFDVPDELVGATT